MRYTNQSTLKLWREKREGRDDDRYDVANNDLPEKPKTNEIILTEKELLEILGVLKELTLEKVLNLLCCDLIKSNITILKELVIVNEKLLNELGYEKIIFEDGVSVKKLDRKRNYYY